MYCIPVDINLDNSDSIQANENGELNYRGKRGTRWADDGSTSQIDKNYVDLLFVMCCVLCVVCCLLLLMTISFNWQK